MRQMAPWQSYEIHSLPSAPVITSTGRPAIESFLPSQPVAKSSTWPMTFTLIGIRTTLYPTGIVRFHEPCRVMNKSLLRGILARRFHRDYNA